MKLPQLYNEYGTKLLGVSIGFSPIKPVTWAPKGLKYCVCSALRVHNECDQSFKICRKISVL